MTIELTDRERAAIEGIDREALVAVTSDLIRGRGENPGETEEETVRRLQVHAERIGASVLIHEIAPGRENLRVRLGDQMGPKLMFLGHSDVVPAGEGWSQDPFEPVVSDGRVIGRGATDMKGGLAAVLSAMEAIHHARPDLLLELLCTADEEDLALGVAGYLETAVPEPLIACIVAEPTNLDVVIGCRGAMNITLEFAGASAHAGRPEDGASAITASAIAVQLIAEEHAALRADSPHPLLGTGSWSVGTIAGGSATSMVPRQCSMSVDRRLMPGERPEQVLADLLDEVRKRIASAQIPGGDRITVTGTLEMVMPGFLTDEYSALPQYAAAAVQQRGGPGKITGWTAACEGGFLAELHGCPTIILGPGDINSQAHQPDESVEIADLVLAAEAYTLIGLRMSDQHDAATDATN